MGALLRRAAGVPLWDSHRLVLESACALVCSFWRAIASAVICFASRCLEMKFWAAVQVAPKAGFTKDLADSVSVAVGVSAGFHHEASSLLVCQGPSD